jgi:3-oxoacyl-[acyl-carrier-protein] synthase III
MQQTRAPRAHRFAVLALAALAALALAVPASAGHKSPAAPGVQAPSNGLVVAIDPATGKIRQPTAAEALALSAQTPMMTKAATMSGSPQFVTFADGTTSAVLGPEFLNVWLVQVNPDGSLSQACVDGANLGNAQLAPAALEEK